MKAWIRRIFSAPLLYFIFMKIRPFTRKNVLLVLCTFALITYSLYSFAVINRLKAETTGITQAYAELIESTVSGARTHQEVTAALSRVLDKATNPIIVTDTFWRPILWNNIYLKRAGAGRTKLTAPQIDDSQREFLTRKIQTLRQTFRPRPIYFNKKENRLMGYLVYGNSMLIRSLYVMPFLEIGLGAAFIILLYLAFHNIRVTERSNLWVGLAKETAHQLGTPISSIMGWVEYARTILDDNTTDPSRELRQIFGDMSSDLTRLSRITARFSQIGSTPSMAPCDLCNILNDVSSYFKIRLPLLRKRISIEYDFNKMPLIQANRDLLEWVFENMLKNAIDAITCNDGKIGIKTEHIAAKQIIRISISDNGQGISWESQKKIFSPGFTTKRRGWGLGLTLAKRIIEDYHKGSIYIAWSQRDKGTIFNVDLPVSKISGSTPSFAA